jgi:hypothetical protein
MSVERVDPANLSAQFGEGVRLRRITVQVTDDDVTDGMEERLGWLAPEDRVDLDPEFRPAGIVTGNYYGLFDSEFR